MGRSSAQSTTPPESEDSTTPTGPLAPATGRRATIEDVARVAEVSVATVSRAVRGLPNVADSTRRRVLEVADRLDYHPDPAAARLAAGRTGTVTVAVPSLSGWYFSSVVSGAEAVCAEAGLEVQVVGITTVEGRDRLFDEARRLERRTDALILVDLVASDEQMESLQRRRVGLATVGWHVAGHAGVRIDDERVGALAARHLVEAGHRRFGLISGPPREPMNPLVAAARERGFRAVLDSLDGDVDGKVDGEVAVASGDFEMTGGYEAMNELLARPERPTAVFAFSDEMAFGALMAMSDHGLEPGVDVAVVGVDDHEFSRVVGLTTIRQPAAEHGAVAARMLIGAMDLTVDRPPRAASDAPLRHREPLVVDVQLVERASSRRPPTRA